MYNVHVYTWGCFVAWLKVALHGPVYHTVFSHSVHTCTHVHVHNAYCTCKWCIMYTVECTFSASLPGWTSRQSRCEYLDSHLSHVSLSVLRFSSTVMSCACVRACVCVCVAYIYMYNACGCVCLSLSFCIGDFCWTTMYMYVYMYLYKCKCTVTHIVHCIYGLTFKWTCTYIHVYTIMQVYTWYIYIVHVDVCITHIHVHDCIIQCTCTCTCALYLHFVCLLHLNDLLFEWVWAHSQSLQYFRCLLHQLQEHVQLTAGEGRDTQ